MGSRIQFGEPIEPEVPKEELPPNFLLAGSKGEWRKAPFQVYFVQSVYAEVWKHVNQTPDIESGGVLVGHHFRTFDEQTTFVVITAAIPQESDNRSSGHFTVGPEEIRSAREKIERTYPGLVTVGWYHSHPGHGIFLSGQDMMIVRSIYDAPWHIAMVIDPKSRTEGIFVGSEGKELGGQASRQLNESWIGLRQVPDGVKAIALYNQAAERLSEGYPEQADSLLKELRRLVEDSSELVHWKERDGYRNIVEMQTKAEAMPRREPSYQSDSEREVESHRPLLPEPARAQRRWVRSPRYSWLVLSAFMAVVFAIFVLATRLLDENWRGWVVLGWGILISYLAVVASGYVVLTRNGESKVNNGARSTRSFYFAGERIMALFLIGLVLILWTSYGISIFKYIPSNPEHTTSIPGQPEVTVSQVPVVVPPSVPATAISTPQATDIPALSPISTSTPPPTSSPTWAPTTTLTTTTVNRDTIVFTAISATLTSPIVP